MNYRHAFHAGNHADVLKHVVLLAVCDALARKPAPCFALDTHAGRGLYALDADAAQRTGEADDGVAKLLAAPPADPCIARYLDAIRACRAAHGEHEGPPPDLLPNPASSTVQLQAPEGFLSSRASEGSARADSSLRSE